MITTIDWIIIGWIVLTSTYSFALFGWDKSRARRAGKSRISEFHLAVASAVGGWPGACAAMLIFRHKTAKLKFKLKFALAFIIWIGLLWAAWRLRE